MSMKLDSRQKYDRVRKFLGQIKLKPQIDPFLFIEDISKYGIYDFCYVNKNPPSFAKIQKKLKQSKYDELSEFIEDLKQIFIAISDYALTEDPLQQICEDFKEQIHRFNAQFLDEFKVIFVEPPKPKPIKVVDPNKKKQEPKPRPPPVLQEANITDKLQMLFLLRANQNNEPYIRSIGSHYGLGMQMEDEYVITLDNKHQSWLQLISRIQ